MRLRTVAVATTFALVLGGAPLGCDDESSETTGKRVALEVKIAASPDSRAFTNLEGWSVEIQKAAVATGALYFYDGDTLFASRRAWIKSAHAHPGHYVAGNAKGQLLGPTSADLLAGATLGFGDGVSGFFRSATFSFGFPPAGPAAAELGAAVIAVEGKATKDGATKTFRFEASADEMKDAKGVPQIEGCPFTVVDVESDGVVSITVKLPLWFEHVQFDGVPDGTTKLPEGPARNQLLRGAKGGSPYVFSFAAR